MWTVTAEGRAEGIYEDLKESFDSRQVKKQKRVWMVEHPARGFKEHSKPEHVVDAEMEQKSLQFRLALKSVQQQLSYMPPSRKVKVSIKCDEKSVQTKVEEV